MPGALRCAVLMAALLGAVAGAQLQVQPAARVHGLAGGQQGQPPVAITKQSPQRGQQPSTSALAAAARAAASPASLLDARRASTVHTPQPHVSDPQPTASKASMLQAELRAQPEVEHGASLAARAGEPVVALAAWKLGLMAALLAGPLAISVGAPRRALPLGSRACQSGFHEGIGSVMLCCVPRAATAHRQAACFALVDPL